MLAQARSESWFRIVLALTLAGALAVFALALAAAWENTADDAYITLRYARNLAGGQGVIWNPGEPAVEGYSNFLFVLLGAAAMKLGGATDPMVALKVLGALAAVGSLIATYLLTLHLATRSAPSDRPSGALIAHAAAAAATITLAVHPGQSFWAVSGMETTLCQFLIVIAAYALSRAGSRELEGSIPRTDAGPTAGIRPDRTERLLLAAASLLVFLASITRPESPVVLGAFLPAAVLGWGVRSVRSRIRVALWLTLPFLALYLPYTIWRLWTFGRWLPNSALCKAGGAGEPWLLAREFLDTGGPLLALAVVALALRPRREHWFLLGTPLIFLAVFYRVDPVMSHLDRHYLAVLPLVAAGAALGLLALGERVLPVRRRQHLGVVVLGVALLFGGLSAPRTLAKVRQAVDLAHPLEELRTELALYLKERLLPGEAYALGDTGLVPFLAGGTVLDIYCLNCREATEPPIDRSPERLADWILSRQPRFVVIQVVAGGAERGVFPADRALQRHPALRTKFTRVRELGGLADPLHYLVYQRRSGGAL